MTTRREDILNALKVMLESDPFFPDTVEIDADLPAEWPEDTPGLAPGLRHAVAVQDGPIEITNEVLGADGDNAFELRLDAVVAYGVIAADDFKRDRRARREAGIEKVQALIAADRTLGLNDEVYAVIDAPAERDDSEAGENLPPIATALIHVSIDYVAASAAG